jgi:hypothetical protein
LQKLTTTSICIFFAFFCKAQQLKSNIAAPYIGLSSYSKGFIDAFGINSNVATLGVLKNKAVGIYAERRYGLEELNNFAATIAIPSKSGTFGLQANRFGFSSFNETQIGLGYGKQLSEKISIGGKVNYYSQQIAGYGKANTVNIEAGLLLHLTAKLNAGISAFNPVGGKFGINQTEKLSSIYKFGLGYDVSEKVFIASEFVKEENAPLNFIGAIHYQFEKKFFAKVGVSAAASNFFAAAGIVLHNDLRLDICISHHQQLGISPGVILQYNFK